MPIEAAIYVERYDFEKLKTITAQAHDAFGHLVLLDYNIRSGRFYTYKSLRNHVQKCCIFLTGGAYAPYTHCMSTPL